MSDPKQGKDGGGGCREWKDDPAWDGNLKSRMRRAFMQEGSLTHRETAYCGVWSPSKIRVSTGMSSPGRMRTVSMGRSRESPALGIRARAW